LRQSHWDTLRSPNGYSIHVPNDPCIAKAAVGWIYSKGADLTCMATRTTLSLLSYLVGKRSGIGSHEFNGRASPAKHSRSVRSDERSRAFMCKHLQAAFLPLSAPPAGTILVVGNVVMVSSKDYCSASRRYGSMMREAERARMLRTLPPTRSPWRSLAFRGWCIARRLALALVRLATNRGRDALEPPVNSRPWQRDGD
jgi:hypothetical protein